MLPLKRSRLCWKSWSLLWIIIIKMSPPGRRIPKIQDHLPRFTFIIASRANLQQCKRVRANWRLEKPNLNVINAIVRLLRPTAGTRLQSHQLQDGKSWPWLVISAKRPAAIIRGSWKYIILFRVPREVVTNYQTLRAHNAQLAMPESMLTAPTQC